MKQYSSSVNNADGEETSVMKLYSSSVNNAAPEKDKDKEDKWVNVTLKGYRKQNKVIFGNKLEDQDNGLLQAARM